MKKIEVPDSRLINTGEQELVQPVIDDFFNSLYQAILNRDNLERGKTMHPYFEIKSAELAQNGQVGDSRVDYLLYQEAVIAVVMQTRTNLNHIRYDFFLNGFDF